MASCFRASGRSPGVDHQGAGRNSGRTLRDHTPDGGIAEQEFADTVAFRRAAQTPRRELSGAPGPSLTMAHRRLLAIDYGRVRHGLAVSDALGMASHPLPALQRKSPAADLALLSELIRERGIERVVIGLPYNMDGSEGPMALEVRRFAAVLGEGLGLVIEFEDERLSTDEAEAFLSGAGLRPSDRKRLRDSVAAAVILRGVLEREAT